MMILMLLVTRLYYIVNICYINIVNILILASVNLGKECHSPLDPMGWFIFDWHVDHHHEVGRMASRA